MIYDNDQLRKDIRLISTVFGTYLPELSCWAYKQGPLTYYYRGAPHSIYAIYINEKPIEISSGEHAIHTTSLMGNTTLTLAMKAEEVND